jgi:hypothetical protein
MPRFHRKTSSRISLKLVSLCPKVTEVIILTPLFLQDTEEEMDKLAARLNELINEYEKECLAKVEMECALRGELEEAAFRTTMLQTELNDMRNTSQMKFMLIEEKSQRVT